MPSTMSDKKFTGNYEARGDEKKFSWMGDGKSLSKNLLYAPLVAYQKVATEDDESSNVQYHPSQYMSNKSSVPKSIQESALVSMIHSMSCDYHRNLAGVGDAKNNGSRPLGLSDVEEKIRQRAVTLIGGGVNTSISINRKPPKSKKRRKRSWEETKYILEKYSSSLSEPDDVISFLQALNSSWNDYIHHLLLKGEKSKGKLGTADVLVQKLENQLIALTRKGIDNQEKSVNSRVLCNTKKKENDACCPFELIGSHVQVTSCDSHPYWIGRFGVLIGETTNTYRIAGFACRKNEKRSKKTKSKVSKAKESGGVPDIGEDVVIIVNVKDSIETERPTLEVFLLPKFGSTFQLIIPLPSSDEPKRGDSEKSKTENSNAKHIRRSVIAMPDEAIGISISDSN